MDLKELKKLIKDNLKISVNVEISSSECSYNEHTYIELIFDGEVISRDEIDGLVIDN